MNDHYKKLNKEAWNNKVPVHVASDFYDVPSFLSGKNTLNEFELKLLGDVKGKSILHLQCHFGQDSISLARMGARVTGVDLSDVAIAKAKAFAEELNVDAKFVCCDVYDTANYVNEQFDIVFTSYGVVGWLPDLAQWAEVINKMLKPGGRFIIAEFHPVVWMFDNDFTTVAYNYFKDDAIVETESGTYADKESALTNTTVSWNHSLAEVMGVLLDKNLRVVSFEEFDYSPYACFNCVEEYMPGRFRIKQMGNKIPMVYSLMAEKP